MDEQIENMLKELLALQTAPVQERAKRQAREKIIDLLTMEHELNWQCVATPYDIVNEMIDLIPSDAEKFIVFFSLEFLEEMVKTRGIDKDSILFVGDNGMESAFASHPDIYGVKSCIMSKDTGYQDGKLIFPETIFNFLKNEDNMKFGKIAVVMNPPYQMNDGGGTGSSAKPIYNLFIEGVIDNLNPDHLVSINPSKWMCGGKGLDTHRERMMNDHRMKKIVHFTGEREIFPTVSIKGGVNFFHWQKDYNGTCEFSHDNTTSHRYLNQYDIIVQDNNAMSILEKVMGKSSKWISDTCLSRNPFSVVSNFSNWKDNGIKCIAIKQSEHYVTPDAFTDKGNVLGKWKVCTSKATVEGSTFTGDVRSYFTKNSMFIVEPNAICTETYLVVNAFDTKRDAEHFISYMKTKFFRFMLAMRLPTQNISKSCFAWVPDVEDYSAPWTDAELYKKFNLSRQEIAYIESKIKEIK